MPHKYGPPDMAPLAGIRVLDLSRVLAGPWCTQILGDLGADVIKIENPNRGDDTRGWGRAVTDTETTYYLAANRNKRSVAVDLAHPEGRRAVREIADQSDILVENFKLGGLAKYALDYDTLSAKLPGLIYCSVSGYGRTGPHAARPGYDVLIQAESGLMSITGEADGPATKYGVAVSDITTGMYAAQAILAALLVKERTGRGQHIDMALLDCSMAILANMATTALIFDTQPARLGNAHPDVVPYQTFSASDGEVVVAVGNDGQFERFARDVLGRADLADDARYKTNIGRIEHREVLIPIIAQIMAAETRAVWIGRLEAAVVPGGNVRTLPESLGSPEAAARGMVQSAKLADGTDIRFAASPLNLSETPVREPTAPPRLGQHTDEVLQEVLGASASDIATLRSSGAVA